MMIFSSLSGCVAPSEWQQIVCEDVSGPSPPEPLPILFTGRGDETTNTFSLEQGVIKISSTFGGSGNFIVWLYDTEGNVSISVNNEINHDYNGSRYFRLNSRNGAPIPGTYFLDISGSGGGWEILIEQPRPMNGTFPVNASEGKGDTAFIPIVLDCGMTKFSFSHNGHENFIVWLYDVDGISMDVLANEIGVYDGSHAVRITYSGIYLMDIRADGNWIVSVQNP
jgi:hypothetical protein